MTKYLNKYRSESARAQWWDYGWNGAYFITICTADREHFFGEIKNGKMILSPTGVIADLLWHEITNHSKYVELGDFVVMPNHIHGILILNKPNETAHNCCCICCSNIVDIPLSYCTIYTDVFLLLLVVFDDEYIIGNSYK